MCPSSSTTTGDTAQRVAFEKLLSDGEQFFQHMQSRFDPTRDEAQLVHMATDGETFGHHHRFGEMALAYLVSRLEGDERLRLTNYGEFPDVASLVTELTTAVPEITTIIHNQNGQKSNIATGEKEQVVFGPGYIEEIALGRRFRIGANTFFQTNSLQAEKLYQTALDELHLSGDEDVLDLYCGTGAITILLAGTARSVTGVELVAASVSAAKENASLNGLVNCRFVEGDVTAFLKGLGDSRLFPVIVIDPPRAGLHPKALKLILEYGPSKLLYISCNPSTFARDTRDAIAAGYRLSRVIPVDMFPHTMHIEVVGLLQRN